MINSININNLSQENVSCLNTALSILMIANDHDSLPYYLEIIQRKSLDMYLRAASQTGDTEIELTIRPTEMLVNFRDLLIFWQNHYLQKDKDCAGLENNTGISFKRWKSTVDLLLSEDGKDPRSLK
jgi:Trpc4-associated protein